MKAMKLIAASAIAVAATCGVATAQVVPDGRVYVFNSKATGPCPALDWHVVGGPNNTLHGMIAWNDMKSMANVSGSVTPDRNFTLNAKEVGGQGRTAVVTGQVRSDGWLTVSIKGPEIDCKGINVAWYTPPASGG